MSWLQLCSSCRDTDRFLQQIGVNLKTLNYCFKDKMQVIEIIRKEGSMTEKLDAYSM